MRVVSLLLCLVWCAAAQASDFRLTKDATVVWYDGDIRFGGLSGVELSDDGQRLLAIGDRGIWVTADLEREDGRLERVRTTGIGPLLGVGGKPLGERETDAEGLAVDAEGRAYVSFEGFHRVRRYDPVSGPATRIPGFPAMQRFRNNTGLESLAIDARDELYAIPEFVHTPKGKAPVFRFRNGAWENPYDIQRRDGFYETDADFGPDGKLYLLERKFKWLGGFQTRLRRFTVSDDRILNEETLLTTQFGDLDNMEGISVWRDSRGDTRVTLLSDDNFFPLQRTMLVEYIVKDG